MPTSTSRSSPGARPSARSATKRAGTRGQPEQTRSAILDAALKEFAQEGVSGARTDAIAQAAGVNKALLYYYFRDKESLYGAVLDRVFAGLAHAVREVLDSDLPPREKVLAFASAHFDYVASSPLFPRLMQRELMRAGRAASPHIERIAQEHFRPTFAKLSAIFEAGTRSGDFRQVDPTHFVMSIIALNVFYFSSTPVIRIVLNEDPLTPERIAQRRAAVLDFIAAALFTRRDAPLPVQQKASRK
jgi:TetR/AcrR family transcriptional regulator